MDKNGMRKKALITGGALGMGAAAAKLLQKSGYDIAIFDLEPQPADSEYSIWHQGDVSSKEDWEKLIKRIESEWGVLDVLINSAGVLGGTGTIDVCDIERFKTVMDINLLGSFLGIRMSADLLKKSTGGSVINFASLSAYRSSVSAVAYVTSKHAIIGLTKTAALDLAQFKIRVNAVVPGIIDTPLLRNGIAKFDAANPGQSGYDRYVANIPAGRVGDPKEVAQLIEFLISDAAVYISGTAIPIDGGFLAH